MAQELPAHGTRCSRVLCVMHKCMLHPDVPCMPLGMLHMLHPCMLHGYSSSTRVLHLQCHRIYGIGTRVLHMYYVHIHISHMACTHMCTLHNRAQTPHTHTHIYTTYTIYTHTQTCLREGMWRPALHFPVPARPRKGWGFLLELGFCTSLKPPKPKPSVGLCSGQHVLLTSVPMGDRSPGWQLPDSTLCPQPGRVTLRLTPALAPVTPSEDRLGTAVVITVRGAGRGFGPKVC